ncbi:Sialidase [Achaetomium macrosporum]|uniref:Sialidase n=1 Tax=Achaetomium macrosporum TaxID=79813 RepID=A0AAN7HAI1_9PEZI|nr:Sialidase [Achaetomium macrosporum]
MARFERIEGSHILHFDNRKHPRLCRLSNGSILMGYTAVLSLDRERAVRVAISRDNGKTFTDHGEILRSRGSMGSPSPSIIQQTPTSRLLAALENHEVEDDANQTVTSYRISVYESIDGGRNWNHVSFAARKEVTRDPPPDSVTGLFDPFLFHSGGPENEIYLFYSEERGGDQAIMRTSSRDRGRSWAGAGRVFPDAPDDGHAAVGRTRGPTGQGDVLVMVLESTAANAGRSGVDYALSYDGGRSFGWRGTVYRPEDPASGSGAPEIVVFRDGSLGVVFMTDEGLGEEANWADNCRIMVVLGTGPDRERKITWGRPELVESAGSARPDILLLDKEEGDEMLHDKALLVYQHGLNVKGRAYRLREGVPEPTPLLNGGSSGSDSMSISSGDM